MVTKTIYEERILREIQGLPESVQKKLEKLIRFFKKELIGSTGGTDKDTLEFLDVCGTWEDDRSVDEQIRAIYDSRKSVEDREANPVEIAMLKTTLNGKF